MRKITYAQAGIEAIREEMLRDKRIIYLGEDIGRFGGPFTTSRGLWKEFGDERVRDTPLSEAAIIGFALGAAINGMKPIAEIMFADLLYLCMDQIVNQVAKIRYMTGGQIKVPMIIRSPSGGKKNAAAQHSQSLEALFMHIPGLKIMVPSTPYDFKGLLKTALKDDNPIISFEHQLLYKMEGEVPEEEYFIPLGKADVKRKGRDVTVLSTSLLLHECLKAADELSNLGIEAEVIDPRTLFPFDKESIINSVTKTHKLVIVHQACLTGGIGAEIGMLIQEAAFDYLDLPVKRIAALDVPVPFSPPLEQITLPNEKRIFEEIRQIFNK